MEELKEKAIAIELVMEHYKTRNIGLIRTKVREDLDIDLSLSEITDYIGVTEDTEQASAFIELNINLL